MHTFQRTIISTLLGTILLGTSNWMWAEEPDQVNGVIPQACQDVRATYKDDKKAINQSCLGERSALTQAQQYCSENHVWNPYCYTPCDQTPPTMGSPKDAVGHQAHADLCLAKQALEDCRAQRAADLEAFQQAVNAVCCPFWPCRVVSCPSIVGDWITYVDWNGFSGSFPVTFNADHTGISGNAPLIHPINWSQNSCDMQFEVLPINISPATAIYTGNVNTDGTHLSGTMVSSGGASGSWTADRVESGADVPADVPSNNDELLDVVTGNPK